MSLLAILQCSKRQDPCLLQLSNTRTPYSSEFYDDVLHEGIAGLWLSKFLIFIRGNACAKIKADWFNIFSNGHTWTDTEMQSNKPHPAKLRRGLKGLKFNIVAHLKMKIATILEMVNSKATQVEL